MPTRSSTRPGRPVHKDGADDAPPGIGVLLARIHPKRQDLIRPVLEHPREFVLLSIREMGAQLKVDAATISRTIVAMGFRTYRDFQRYLHQRSITHSTAFERLRAADQVHASLEERVHLTLKQDLRNLEAFYRNVDTAQLIALADRVYAAERIYVLGGDLAASLVMFLHYQLIVLGLNAIAVTSAGHATYLMQRATKNDLVIAISFRKGLRQTIEGLARARARGCYTVGITDTSVSPVMRMANEVLLAPVDVPNFGASYVAPMAVVDALLSAIAHRKRARTMAVLKQMETEQIAGSRWAPESDT